MKARVHWLALLAAVTIFAADARCVKAAIIPVGPQNDVPLATVTGAWGWTQIYRGDYSIDSVSVASMFASAGQYVMIGGIRDGSATIDVLAAALTTDVLTYTPFNVTHAANGSQWYFNGGSMGFAGLSDTISQSQADINGFTERDRLSWHTDAGSFIGQYGLPALNVRYGWRSGSNLGLNLSTDWDKIVFTVGAAPVPEPSTLALLGMGLTCVGAPRLLRRRSWTAT